MVYEHIKQHIIAEEFPWIIEFVASERALTLYYNSLQVGFRDCKRAIEACLESFDSGEKRFSKTKTIVLPVCYEANCDNDLYEVSRLTNLDVEEVIQSHLMSEFMVSAVGFVPGFAYLKGLDEKIQLARKSSPRKRVPKGAVAIAEDYSAVYPTESPGGWHILGLCPLPMFDLNRKTPNRLQVAKKVKFERIDIHQFNRMLEA